jgi:hypothetical protein
MKSKKHLNRMANLGSAHIQVSEQQVSIGHTYCYEKVASYERDNLVTFHLFCAFRIRPDITGGQPCKKRTSVFKNIVLTIWIDRYYLSSHLSYSVIDR